MEEIFILENPQTSQIWYTEVLSYLLNHPKVTYGTLDMCAFGMKNPNGYYYYKPTSLMRSFQKSTVAPVFRRCPNRLGGDISRSTDSQTSAKSRSTTHIHQPLEGSAPGYGSRAKLAQIYPYRFCSALIRCLLPIGNQRGLVSSQTSLLIDLLDQCFETTALQDLQKHVGREEAPVFTTAPKHTSIPVKQRHIRRALAYTNSLPFGYSTILYNLNFIPI